MTFNWSEFLLLARSLVQETTGTGEAAYRTAISRAYYAAFCTARGYAQEHLEYMVRGASDDHFLLREHFRSNGLTDIVTRLDQLRRWRNQCDYDGTLYNLPTIVPIAIRMAQEVLDMTVADS